MFFGGEEELERKTSHTQALPSSSSWSGRWDDGKNKVQGREGCGELCMRGELVMSEDASRVKHLFWGRCRNHHRGGHSWGPGLFSTARILGSPSYYDVNWSLKNKQHFNRCFPLFFSLGISQCFDFICVLWFILMKHFVLKMLGSPGSGHKAVMGGGASDGGDRQ